MPDTSLNASSSTKPTINDVRAAAAANNYHALKDLLTKMNLQPETLQILFDIACKQGKGLAARAIYEQGNINPVSVFLIAHHTKRSYSFKRDELIELTDPNSDFGAINSPLKNKIFDALVLSGASVAINENYLKSLSTSEKEDFNKDGSKLTIRTSPESCFYQTKAYYDYCYQESCHGFILKNDWNGLQRMLSYAAANHSKDLSEIISYLKRIALPMYQENIHALSQIFYHNHQLMIHSGLNQTIHPSPNLKIAVSLNPDLAFSADSTITTAEPNLIATALYAYEEEEQWDKLLQYASKYHYTREVRVAIKNETELFTDDQGHTPLFWAARHGDETLVNWLVKKGLQFPTNYQHLLEASLLLHKLKTKLNDISRGSLYFYPKKNQAKKALLEEAITTISKVLDKGDTIPNADMIIRLTVNELEYKLAELSGSSGSTAAIFSRYNDYHLSNTLQDPNELNTKEDNLEL